MKTCQTGPRYDLFICKKSANVKVTPGIKLSIYIQNLLPDEVPENHVK